MIRFVILILFVSATRAVEASASTNDSPPIRSSAKAIQFGVAHAAESSKSSTSTSTSTSEPNTPTPYTYIPVSALNKYGASTQLQHALLSSTKQGSVLTLAATAEEDDGSTSSARIVVGTIRPKPPPGVISSRNWIHAISRDDADTTNEQQQWTGLLYTGIQSDGMLVTSMLRDYGRRVWERYNAVLGCEGAAEALSRILTCFMNYDRTEELVDGCGPVVPSSDDDGGFQTGRPFGIQCLLLGVGGETTAIVSMDPSGVAVRCYAAAIGRCSSDAKRLLEQRWRSGMSVADVRDLFVEIGTELFREDQGQEDNGDCTEFLNERFEIVCDVISSTSSTKNALKRIPFLATPKNNLS